jgi:hypothetical protein
MQSVSPPNFPLIDRDWNCLSNISTEDIDFPPWVKRIEDIFEKPQFFIDGASAEDVHQGEDGDCWFLAALMALCAKKELVDKLCVARDEKVGVYGFVFFRGQCPKFLERKFNYFIKRGRGKGKSIRTLN